MQYESYYDTNNFTSIMLPNIIIRSWRPQLMCDKLHARQNISPPRRLLELAEMPIKYNMRGIIKGGETDVNSKVLAYSSESQEQKITRDDSMMRLIDQHIPATSRDDLDIAPKPRYSEFRKRMSECKPSPISSERWSQAIESTESETPIAAKKPFKRFGKKVEVKQALDSELMDQVDSFDIVSDLDATDE